MEERRGSRKEEKAKDGKREEAKDGSRKAKAKEDMEPVEKVKAEAEEYTI